MRYLVSGIILSCLLFWFIESSHPYAFLGGDNLTELLPGLLVGIKQMFSGTMPYYNMHHLAGVPLLEMVLFSFLYPLTILSYVISHGMLNNDFLMMEVFLGLHLILGFIAMFFLLKKMKVDNLVALLGGIAYPFSGYILMASVGWYHIGPLALFVPLIFLLQLNNLNGPSTKNTLLLGLVRGIYFYTGNLQYFIYTLFFEFLFIAFFILSRRPQDKMGARQPHAHWLPETISSETMKSIVVHYALSMVLTFILALPLGTITFLMSRGNSRGGTFALFRYLDTQCRLNVSPVDFVLGNIFPYPLYNSVEPLVPGLSAFGNVNYTGTIFFISSIFGVIVGIRKLRKHFLTRFPFFLLAVIAVLLSFGCLGLLYTIMVVVPFWNQLFMPFKLILYANFFIVLFGSQSLTLLLGRGRRWNIFRVALLIFFLSLTALQAYYSVDVQFSPYGVRSEMSHYLPQKALVEDLADGRIVAYSTGSKYSDEVMRRGENGAAVSETLTMQHVYASYYNLYTLGGYEPLQSSFQAATIPISRYGIANRAVDLDWLSEWGVKYLFVPYDSLQYHPELQGFATVKNLEDAGILVLENPDAKPIVFCEQDISPHFTLMNHGLEFSTYVSSPTECIVSLVHNENFKLIVNGENQDYSPDSLGRITFALPQGHSEVELVYDLPIFRLMFIVALVFAALFVAFFSLFRGLFSFLIQYAEQYKWIIAALVILMFLLSSVRVVLSINEILPLKDVAGCMLQGEVFAPRECVKANFKEDISIQRESIERISTPLLTSPEDIP